MEKTVVLVAIAIAIVVALSVAGVLVAFWFLNASAPRSVESPTLAVQRIAPDAPLQTPVAVAAAFDSDGNAQGIFVAEQTGRVLFWSNDASTFRVALDVRAQLIDDVGRRASGSGASVNPYDERGLLGLATRPDRPNVLYIFMSELPRGVERNRARRNHDDVLYEVPLNTANHRASPDRRQWRELLRVPQAQFNHNGGALLWHDGALLLTVGDGGGAYDNGPNHVGGANGGSGFGNAAQTGNLGNAQHAQTLMGKVLRIELQPNDASPPRVSTVAIGLRNSFGMALDALTGDLFLTVVGEARFESLYKIPAAFLRRRQTVNLGWRVLEGALLADATAMQAVTSADSGAEPDAPWLLPIAGYCHPALDDRRVPCTRYSPTVRGLSPVGGAVLDDGTFLFADWSASFVEPRGQLLCVRNARSAQPQQMSTRQMQEAVQKAVRAGDVALSITLPRVVQSAAVLGTSENVFYNCVTRVVGPTQLWACATVDLTKDNAQGGRLLQLVLSAARVKENATQNQIAAPAAQPKTNSSNGGNNTLHVVRVRGFSFEPTSLTVRRGDTVCWRNLAAGRHNVAEIEPTGDACAPTKADGFTSGEPGAVDEWCHQFNQVGTFAYKCEPHCDGFIMRMHGNVSVLP